MRTDLEKGASSLILKKYGQFFKIQYQELSLISKNEMWEENKSFLPIHITMSPSELIPITDIMSSDNTLITKVLSVLTSLCVEVTTLKKEAFER